MAALELKLFGADLARQTIRNAQVAGQYLFENGLKVLGGHKGFTKSHQIAVDVRNCGGGRKVAEKLEEANIILNRNLLPYDDQHNREEPGGIRIGFQDVTRRGFMESDIKYLCDLILDVIKESREASEVRRDVVTLMERFNQVKYGFQSVEEALKTCRRQSS
jgi:glycine hydroxymethyltransferase